MNEESKKQQPIISAITVWEIALLIKKRKIILSADPEKFLDYILSESVVKILPIDALIARNSVVLPDALHKDPADRIIIATAVELRIPLITADKKIRDYPHVKTIW